MKSLRPFSLLILCGSLVACASLGYAQDGGVELKRRIHTQLTSPTRGQAGDNGANLGETASTMATHSNVSIAGADKKKALLGTWNVTLTFGDGSEVQSTLQVFPGRSEVDGSVIHASEFSLVPPNPTLPEQGVWEFVGGQRFITSYRGYSFTEDLQPFGTIGFRHAITISSDQETFTGRAVFEVIDANGQVLFSDNLQTRGIRQHAVAP
jgi:hypothetical protein